MAGDPTPDESGWGHCSRVYIRSGRRESANYRLSSIPAHLALGLCGPQFLLPSFANPFCREGDNSTITRGTIATPVTGQGARVVATDRKRHVCDNSTMTGDAIDTHLTLFDQLMSQCFFPIRLCVLVSRAMATHEVSMEDFRRNDL